MKEAIHKDGAPEIMNFEYGPRIAAHLVCRDGPAAMDGDSHLVGRQGAFLDHNFVERLWRSLI